MPLLAVTEPCARRGAFMQVRQALQERFADLEVLPRTYPVPALKARTSACLSCMASLTLVLSSVQLLRR